MTRITKLRIQHIGQLTLWTVAILVGGWFGVRFAARFEKWQFLGVLWSEVALAGVLVQLYRWARFPGLVYGRSFASLALNLVLSAGFIAGIVPVYVMLGLVPIAGHALARQIPFRQWTFRLGLEFRYPVLSTARVSSLAPVPLIPGALGKVASIRVTEPSIEGKYWSLAPGSVIYTLVFSDDTEAEVPEEYLVWSQIY